MADCNLAAELPGPEEVGLYITIEVCMTTNGSGRVYTQLLRERKHWLPSSGKLVSVIGMGYPKLKGPRQYFRRPMTVEAMISGT